jgi:ABC-type multidrug transport system permease subunit
LWISFFVLRPLFPIRFCSFGGIWEWRFFSTWVLFIAFVASVWVLYGDLVKWKFVSYYSLVLVYVLGSCNSRRLVGLLWHWEFGAV